jgi:hypothetical protein
MEISRSANGRYTNSKEPSSIQPDKTTKYGAPIIKMEELTQRFKWKEQWPNPWR